MADDGINRILDKLDVLSTNTAKLEERVTGLADRIDKYNNVTGRTADIEKNLELMQQKCGSIQDAKSKSSVPWGSVKSGIIVGIIVGVIMLIVNLLAVFTK